MCGQVFQGRGGFRTSFGLTVISCIISGSAAADWCYVTVKTWCNGLRSAGHEMLTLDRDIRGQPVGRKKINRAINSAVIVH